VFTDLIRTGFYLIGRNLNYNEFFVFGQNSLDLLAIQVRIAMVKESIFFCKNFKINNSNIWNQLGLNSENKIAFQISNIKNFQ
jgi:hypothetical protein